MRPALSPAPSTIRWSVLVLGLSCSPWLLATNAEDIAWFNLSPAVTDNEITVSIDFTTASVRGWSFGLGHDPAKARMVKFERTDELATIQDGAPPDFYICEEAAGEGRSGLIQAVVLSTSEPRVLPRSAGGFPVLRAKYEATAETTVTICDDLQGSGRPVKVAITNEGISYRPGRMSTATLMPRPTAWFNISPPVSDGHVTVTIDFSTARVQGWSLGLCHDAEKARLGKFGWTEELARVYRGSPPEFYKCEQAWDGARAGIIQAAVLAYQEPVLLPLAAGGFPVLTADYLVEEESRIEICDGLRGSGQPIRSVVTDHGRSIRPWQPASASLVTKPYAEKLAYRVEPPRSGEVVTVKLFSTDLAVEGWSFALCSTARAAEVAELATSPEVQEILGGEPPEFVRNEITRADPYLAVKQSVILGTPLEPFALGPFPEGLPVLGIRYRVLEDDDLKFCDGSGGIAFDNRVTVEGIQYVPGTRIGGSLVRGALGTRFIRGDVDLNGRVEITDPIQTLTSLFLSGGPLPCLDAADANDVGPTIDLSDPIFTLRFLFLGGEPPPAPFPLPGEDLSPRTALGCERGI